MRRGVRRGFWGLGLLIVALAVFLVPTIWFKPWSIDHYYMRVFLREAGRHPMLGGLWQRGVAPAARRRVVTDEEARAVHLGGGLITAEGVRLGLPA